MLKGTSRWCLVATMPWLLQACHYLDARVERERSLTMVARLDEVSASREMRTEPLERVTTLSKQVHVVEKSNEITAVGLVLMLAVPAAFGVALGALIASSGRAGWYHQ